MPGTKVLVAELVYYKGAAQIKIDYFENKQVFFKNRPKDN
jgi:hypothetical protein